MQILTLPSILERVLSEAKIDTIYFTIDPVSLKVASQITLKKVRKKYINSLEDFIMEWLTDPADAIVVLAPEKPEVLGTVSLLSNFVPISSRNGEKTTGKNCIFILLARNKEVARTIVGHAIESNVEILMPFDLDALAYILITLVRNKRSGVIVCESSLIEEGRVASSQPAGTTSLVNIEMPAIEIGSGSAVVLTSGAMFKTIFSLLSEHGLLEKVRLIGILKFSPSLAGYLVSILKNYKYIAVVDQTNIVELLLRSSAYDLIAQGEIGWIPEIVNILRNAIKSTSTESSSILCSLKGFLSLDSRIEDAPKVQTRDEILFLVSSGIDKFIKDATRAESFSVLCVKPLTLAQSDSNSLEIHESMNYASRSENTIIIMHISHLTKYFSIIRPFLKEDDRVVMAIADASFIEKGLLDRLKDTLRSSLEHTGMKIPVIDLAECDLDDVLRKLRKFRKIIVLA